MARRAMAASCADCTTMPSLYSVAAQATTMKKSIVVMITEPT